MCVCMYVLCMYVCMSIVCRKETLWARAFRAVQYCHMSGSENAILYCWQHLLS